jgi:hypothetical protein
MSGLPSRPSTGRDLFLADLEQTRLPQILGRYEPEARLSQTLARPIGTYPAAEMLIAASANSPAGTGVTVSAEDQEEMLRISQRLLLRAPLDEGIQLSLLRTLRGIRPAWLSAPMFERILKPFDDQMVQKFGTTSEEMFGAVVRIGDATRGSEVHDLDLFRALPQDSLIDHDNIREPADLWNYGVVRVGRTVLPLDHRMAEVVYRIVCRTLAKEGGQFTTAKGASLEAIVKEELRSLAPSWRWFTNYTIGREDGDEKDLLGVGPGVGIAVETKSVVFRRTSADWSLRNLLSDLAPLREAKIQLRDPTELLQTGGRVWERHRSTVIAAARGMASLVVTDEVLSPLIDAYGPEPVRTTDAVTDVRGTDHRPLVVSIVDVALLRRLSRIPPVFLDYVTWRHRHPSTRTLDIPESWIFYGTDPFLQFTADGGALSSEANEWTDVRELGFDSIRPPWIYRWSEIERAEVHGNTLKAVRLIEADRRASARHFPNPRHREQLGKLWHRHSKLLTKDGYRTLVRDANDSGLGGPSTRSIRNLAWEP